MISSRAEDQRLPRHVRLQDALWRALLRASFLLFEAYCFVFRPHVKGVYVAVWYHGEVLLLENSYRPCLYFPCGGVKLGELPLEAARRELIEEVGIDVPLEKLVLAYEAQIRHDNMRDHVSTFEVHLDREPALTVDRREVIAARFMDLGATSRLSMAPVVRNYVDWKLGEQPVA